MSGNASHNKKKPGNTTAFFICILVAALLWAVRTLNTTYSHTLTLPVRFINVPQNKKPLQALPESLRVDVKASGLKLLLILAARPYRPLSIDFNELKSANRQFSYILSQGSLRIRSSIRFDAQVRQISPDTIYFTEKHGIQKMVPVRPVLFASCAPGFASLPARINPAFVTVSGDSSVINQIDTVYTEPLSLSDLTAPVRRKIALVKPSPLVFLESQSVDLDLHVDRLVERIAEVSLRYELPDLASAVHLFPERVKVKYTVLRSAEISGDSLFRAKVELKGRRSGKAPVALSTVPGGAHVIAIIPAEVEFLMIRK